jgi:hypothetical protein
MLIRPATGTTSIQRRTEFSEDVITAFAFAVGLGYEHIADPNLKQLIAEDIRAVARHFLDHDFGIVSQGRRVDFNPYLGITDADLDAYLSEFLDPNASSVESALEAYRQFASLRDQYNALAAFSDFAQLLTFGCLPSFDPIPKAKTVPASKSWSTCALLVTLTAELHGEWPTMKNALSPINPCFHKTNL